MLTSFPYKCVNKQTRWVHVRRVFKVRNFRTRTSEKSADSDSDSAYLVWLDRIFYRWRLSLLHYWIVTFTESQVLMSSCIYIRYRTDHFYPWVRAVYRRVYNLLCCCWGVVVSMEPWIKLGNISADRWSNIVRHDQTWSDMIRHDLKLLSDEQPLQV
jgi:hypothetical protein